MTARIRPRARQTQIGLPVLWGGDSGVRFRISLRRISLPIYVIAIYSVTPT
jgi:hypothetical protein